VNTPTPTPTPSQVPAPTFDQRKLALVVALAHAERDGTTEQLIELATEMAAKLYGVPADQHDALRRAVAESVDAEHWVAAFGPVAELPRG